MRANAAAEWRSFWFLPFAAALGYSTSVIAVYSLGAFIGPLTQEFGWSRAQISVGISVACFISAIFSIPVGILVDRIGPRRIALIGMLAMCAAYSLLSTTTGSAGAAARHTRTPSGSSAMRRGVGR